MSFVTHRLVWFELQVTPFDYRFAIIPSQPVLIGMPEGDGGGEVMLIQRDDAPEVCDRIVEEVDVMVRESGVLRLAPTDPDRAFAEALMHSPGVHVRIAYADETRWAAAFPIGGVPDEVATLIDRTKALARRVMDAQSSRTIGGDEALEQLQAAPAAPGGFSRDVVLKVHVSRAGEIAVNGRPAGAALLEQALDELKSSNGVVWYSREGGDAEPTPAAEAAIKLVLDAVTARKLPVRLLDED